MIEMHAIATGKVQGVGFRHITTRYAKKLGIKGTVRNLSDGSVEIYAQGPEDSLKKLVVSLCQEFDLDRNAVSMEFSPVIHPYEDFKIS